VVKKAWIIHRDVKNQNFGVHNPFPGGRCKDGLMCAEFGAGEPTIMPMMDHIASGVLKRNEPQGSGSSGATHIFTWVEYLFFLSTPQITPNTDCAEQDSS
jgi:hypothetical protein